LFRVRTCGPESPNRETTAPQHVGTGSEVCCVPLIVFDLDGTILDSRRDLADSTNDVLGSYGAAALPVDRVAGMIGEGARVLVQRAAEATGLQVDLDEALDRFGTFYDRRLLLNTRPYAGIEPVLQEAARQADLAVLTNKPASFTHRLLEAFDMSAAFRWVIGGDSPFPRKPDPAALIALMDRARSTPDRTLVVGDSMIDIETARRAGVHVCIAWYGYGHLRGEMTLQGDELIARTPEEVGEAIENFFGTSRGPLV
jgi:phosphoglycolate phosphatase